MQIHIQVSLGPSYSPAEMYNTTLQLPSDWMKGREVDYTRSLIHEFREIVDRENRVLNPAEEPSASTT